jgi:carbon storage regulator
MLVLSRKEGERLVIGDDITIVVSKVNGNRVSIGIEAPRDVRIVREELTTKTPATEEQSSTAHAFSAEDLANAILPIHRNVG